MLHLSMQTALEQAETIVCCDNEANRENEEAEAHIKHGFLKTDLLPCHLLIGLCRRLRGRLFIMIHCHRRRRHAQRTPFGQIDP